ncbi:type I deoxyribonuclease HsdR [Halostagnicola larsenii XH-48]|uniref:Type I deoxyribonuclease HsdR n=1 Tax=Halostagnicola larsenii XH-48 TaxID=797299 RepID=W0JSL6_9EURY|nr:HTTM domain-containing protein [Halostagnicola larsenii]AHF99982.1 type I deoxyribonuclease HsdR [Halostagnicola larsenii XH-48]
MSADRSPPPDSSVADTGLGPAVRSLIRARLGIDPRALAAFRIALGTVLVADLLVLRVPGLVPFYTDAGVFPRSALAETYPAFASVSIHALSGSPWVQGILFAIAGVFAVCLCLGYRTRLATLVSVVLLASLQIRNPHVLNGGDTILTSLLFLGLFLPLGARWSLDARRRARESDGQTRMATASGGRIVSVATVTILGHFVIIYATNAILKFQSEPWMEGVAVRRIFYLEQFLAFLGPSLSEFPLVLTAVNWAWIGTLSAAPLLVLLVGWGRTAVVAAFVCSHLGMVLTMQLGAFPFVMITGLLLFLPPRVWDRVERSRTRAILDGLETRTRTKIPRRPGLSMPSIPSIQIPATFGRAGRIGATVILVTVLLTSTLWQTAQAGLVDSPAPELEGSLDDVGWVFFAPNPPDASTDYVVEAELESGDRVDLATGEQVTLDRPPNPAQTYPSTLWKHFGMNIRYADASQFEPSVEYVCAQSDRNIETVTIYSLEQPVGPDGPTGDPVADERISRAC